MNGKPTPQTSCRPDLLQAAVDDELTPRQQRWLAKHLEDCASCATEYAELQAVVAHCRNLPQLDAPAELLREVQRSVRVAQARAKRESWLTRLRNTWWVTPASRAGFVGLVAAVVVICVVVALGPNRGGTATSTSLSVIARASESVAGLDLVFTYNPEDVDVEQAVRSSLTGEFLFVASNERGRLRVSMASPAGVRLDDSAVMKLQLLTRRANAAGDGALALEDARAYRPDGTRVPIRIQQVPALL